MPIGNPINWLVRVTVRFRGRRLTHELTIAEGGQLVAVRTDGLHSRSDEGYPRDWKRARIGGFTRRSKSRLTRLLASLNLKAQRRAPLFVTLTYHNEWPQDAPRLKQDLDTFLHRLRRKWPQAAIIWRLELQERGAPHFHLIILGVAWIDRDWLACVWNECASYPGLERLRAGTQVRRARNWTETRRELAKYVAKQSHLPEGMYLGRHWGVYGRRWLPVQLMRSVIGYGQFIAIRDVILGHLRRAGVPEGDWGPYRGAWGCLDPPERNLIRQILEG